MDFYFEFKRNFVCEVCGVVFYVKNIFDIYIVFKYNDFWLF